MIDGDGIRPIGLDLHRVGAGRLGSIDQGESAIDIAIMVTG